MKNKNILAAVAGLAAIGAGVGAALVYLKKKQPKEADVEETDEDLLDEECDDVEPERTYTVLSDVAPATEEPAEETVEETTEPVAEEA